MKYHIPCARYIIRRSKESCLYKKNKKGLTPLDIMTKNINEVKEEDVPTITPDEVKDYVVNNNSFVVYKALNKENVFKNKKMLKTDDLLRNVEENSVASPSNKFFVSLKDKFFGGLKL